MAKKGSSSSTAKTGSATTSRTGQVGAAETKVTPVDDDGKAAARAASKEAPGREGHAAGVPRKSVLAKFGPKNATADHQEETRVRQAATGGL
jgi:hypothetical protein